MAGRFSIPDALLCLGILFTVTNSLSLLAQTRVGFNPSGMWSAMYHEDELERTDPGSPVGDYLGMPINDDARLRADSWDSDLISVPEHQCIPHSSVYCMRAPSNLKISTIEDPTTAQIIAFIIDGTYDGPRTIWMDRRPHPSQFAAHTSCWPAATSRRHGRLQIELPLRHALRGDRPRVPRTGRLRRRRSAWISALWRRCERPRRR